MPSGSYIDDKDISWKRKELSIFIPATGVHTGGPPFAEVGSTGYLAFEMEQGDILRQMVRIPKDLDPDQPIGISARVTSGSTTAGDLLTLDLLYEIVAHGGALFPGTVNDAPATDFATVNPTTTAFTESKTRAIIAADTLTAAQVANGCYLALQITATDIDCDTNGNAEGFFIVDLVMDYVPKRCRGESVENDIPA